MSTDLVVRSVLFAVSAGPSCPLPVLAPLLLALLLALPAAARPPAAPARAPTLQPPASAPAPASQGRRRSTKLYTACSLSVLLSRRRISPIPPPWLELFLLPLRSGSSVMAEEVRARWTELSWAALPESATNSGHRTAESGELVVAVEEPRGCRRERKGSEGRLGTGEGRARSTPRCFAESSSSSSCSNWACWACWARLRAVAVSVSAAISRRSQSRLREPRRRPAAVLRRLTRSRV